MNQNERTEQLRNTAVAAVFCALLTAVLLLFVIMPDKSFSDIEKRDLSDFPSLSLSSLVDGRFESALEVYLQDQFPARKAFVGIGSYFDALLQRNGVDGIYHGKDGYLLNEPVTPDDRKLSKNIGKLNDFAKGSSLDSYLMIVPSAGYIMSDMLPLAARTYRDGEILDSARTLADGFGFIDLREPYFESRNEQQLYYKTDHHFTSAGAYLAYEAFCNAAGHNPVPRSAFSVEKHDGFFGTTYSKAALWLKKPDTMELWSTKSKLSVTVSDTGKEAVTNDSVFFRDYLTKYDMYPVYLNGNHSCTVITNPDAPGGSLLMLKDSYGNTLATLLAQSYRTTVMVDLRHNRTQSVSAVIDEYNIDTLLAVYGIDDIINDTNFTWLK